MASPANKKRIPLDLEQKYSALLKNLYSQGVKRGVLNEEEARALKAIEE